jgi:hydroxyacid-oxoacid transhydrogenase
MLKPTLGLVDPDNMASVPPEVAVASGFDVLCHALESYTALPFSSRGPRPASPALRPAYQGANPFSDVWATHALRLLARYFVRSVADRGDAEAREGMAFAATAAGVGFGSAGVHLCHGMSYAVSGLNPGYVHPGYSPGVKLVPHGISVVLPAPAIFRRTAAVSPARHLLAAKLLAGEDAPVPVAMYGGGGGGRAPRGGGGDEGRDAGARLAEQLLRYMDRLKVPNGLGALGFSAADVPALVEATLPQRRVLALAPSEESAGREALAELFAASLNVY